MQQHCGGQQPGQHCHAVTRSQHRCHECGHATVTSHAASRGVLLCPRLPADCGSPAPECGAECYEPAAARDTPTLRQLRPTPGSALTGVGRVVEVLSFSINTFLEYNTLSHLENLLMIKDLFQPEIETSFLPMNLGHLSKCCRHQPQQWMLGQVSRYTIESTSILRNSTWRRWPPPETGCW